MRWLLDANAWIDYLRNPHSAVRARLAERSPEAVVTCAVVRAELMHSAGKHGDVLRRQAMVRDALTPFVSLPFDDAAADQYAVIRDRLETLGEVIGPYDMQIAAICLAHGCTLVTGNVTEFRRIHGLQVENWTATVV